jgi:hypothetical protein
MRRLVDAFNPATVDGLMCRTTLNVGWDGRLFDCDFNQMLDLPVTHGAPRTVADLLSALDAGAAPGATASRPDTWAARAIATGPHCFGCTAGAGSSCGGATT